MQATILKQIIIVYVLGMMLVSAGSCQKETVSGESRLDLLTGNKWQLTNLYHQDVGDNTVSDFTSIHYTSCESDDSYHFTIDHVFFRRDSSNTCIPAPHFGLYGTARWTADSALSKISFASFPNYDYNMEIKTLTQSTLELTHHVRDYFMKDIIYTYRFRSLP